MDYRAFRILSDIIIGEGELDVPQPPTPTDNTITDTVLPLVFGTFASIAFLIIVIAGIQFILSRGDPQKSTTARNAIIYACVGFAISLLAFSIVKFVVGQV